MPSITEMLREAAPEGWVPINQREWHHVHSMWRKGLLDIHQVEGVRYYDRDLYHRLLVQQDVRPTPPEPGLLRFSEIAIQLNVSKGKLYAMARKGLFPVSYRNYNGSVKHARQEDVRQALLLV